MFDTETTANHFHIFIHVPEAKLLVHARPTKKYMLRFWKYRKSFLRRMWNSSEFMRTYETLGAA